MYRLVLFITVAFLFQLSFGQDMNQVKQVVADLSSPAFFGRGYVNKGDSLAADYIALALKKRRIKPIGKSYFQHFEMGINRYIGNPKLKIAGQTLQNGIDWVPYPTSPTVHGTFPVIWITQKDLVQKKAFQQLCKQDLQNSFITFDTCVVNNQELHRLARNLFTTAPYLVKGIVDAVESPKFSARRYVSDYVTLRVRNEFWTHEVKEIEVDLDHEFIEDYTSQNVMGFIPGKTDTCITLIGHYDHMGMFGEVMYPGANDNASGVAMMLELGDYFKKHKPHYSIHLIFFGAEEAGFYGSEYYVAHPAYPLAKTKMVINFDMVASGTKWTELIQAKLYPAIESAFVNINTANAYIEHLKTTGYEASSDHINFHDQGIPAVFFWTAGGNEFYHEPGDLPDSISYPAFEGIYKLVQDFVEITGNSL